MMKITYIQHSGFAVELADKVLIFDYYKGELPSFESDRDVYVFVSHRHYDHFQRSIFQWAEEFPRITYILSGDVKVNPYRRGTETSCDYCSYRQICGFDTKMEGYRYREIDAMSVDKVIQTIKGERQS